MTNLIKHIGMEERGTNNMPKNYIYMLLFMFILYNVGVVIDWIQDKKASAADPEQSEGSASDAEKE